MVQLARNPLTTYAQLDRERLKVTQAALVFREDRRSLVAETHTAFEKVSFLNMPSRTHEVKSSMSCGQFNAWVLTRVQMRSPLKH